MSRSKGNDESAPRLGGIDYSKVMDRQVGDKRFERERQGTAAVSAKPVSATFDAFQRLAAGLDGRTIADKISDPNRPTWEQYKKENEEKLDLVGDEVRKMVEYREQLDRERERRLREAGGRHRGPLVSDSDEDSDDSSASSDSSSNSSYSSGDSSDNSSNDRHRSKKKRKETSKKSRKHSKKHKHDKKAKKEKKDKKPHRKRHKSDEYKSDAKRRRRSDSSDANNDSHPSGK